MYVFMYISMYVVTFSSETTGPIEAKFHMAPPWDGGTKVISNIKGQGHPLALVQGHSDPTFSNFFFLETARPIETKFHVKLKG